MNDIAIRVENLSKQYTIGRAQERHDTLRDALSAAFRRKGTNGSAETFWALKDVSFEVKRGEVVGIIGRNGAGKSTLLKILSQITEPTSGRASIYGRVGSLLEVGTGFHPELTGRENIYLNGAILGMRREEITRQFDEIVAFSEIEKFLDTPVKRYSSGMYVRLAFAVAAHLEPEILLVDEVLAVGDAAFQKKALGKMGSVVNEGRTVVFVSHNMAAIQNLCQKVMLLEGGQLKEIGTPSKIVDQYLVSDRKENCLTISHAERTGDQRAYISDFRLQPNPPKTGMPVEFIFDVVKRSSIEKLSVDLAVSILSLEGAPIFQVFTRHMGKEILLSNTQTKVVASIDNLPLIPGQYLVNLWLGVGNSPIDWLRNSFTLRVETGKILNGEYVQSRGYPVIVPSQWANE